MFGWSEVAAFVPAPVAATSPGALRAARQIVGSLARDHDVVHAHGLRAGALAVLTGARPLVTTWHNGRLPGQSAIVYGVLQRIGARGSDVLLAASEDLAAQARRAGGRDVRFVAVAAPPLPTAHRDPADVRAELEIGDRPVVLCVARLAPQKRLDLLVSATAGWAADATRPVVLIAGGGAEADLRRLQDAATMAGSSVRLLGHRPDVADLLAAADLAVLPSDWEARPLVAQEALRAGVPLVATAVGGVPGLVGPAAVLVPRGDGAALSSALLRLCGDPGERARLAELGRVQAATWPTLDEMTDTIERCYLDLRSKVR
jgi:glycosyltransferase involved in cell wall biosynthesis